MLLACALLTKEMAVMFSALIGIYAWLHPAEERHRRGRKVVGAAMETAPYAAVTLAYSCCESTRCCMQRAV